MIQDGFIEVTIEEIKNPSVGTHGTSNPCRDARSVRPLCQRLQQALVLTGTDAQIVRPYSRYSSCFDAADARDKSYKKKPLARCKRLL